MPMSFKQGARLLLEGAVALSQLETNGVRVDVPYVQQKIKETEAKIADYEKQLTSDKVWTTWKNTHNNPNLGSKAQLGKVIFDVLGYTRKVGLAKKSRDDEGQDGRRTPKNDAASFENCDLPFVKAYFRMEKLKKLKSTYFDGIVRELHDGRVHPFFHLNKVITFRSSSSCPNFQNIPIRNEEIASLIRRCFIPEPGHHFVEVDYAQQEVRAAACYTHDSRLMAYINDTSTDMHRDMAAKLFMLPAWFMLEEAKWCKKSVRDWAKNRFVFPEFYGSVYFQCAPHLWAGVLKAPELPDTKGLHAWISERVKLKEGEKPTLRHYLEAKGVTELGDCEPGGIVRKGTFVHLVREAERYLWDETFTEYTAWKKRAYGEYLRRGYFDFLTGFRVHGLYARNDVLNAPIQGSAFHCLLQSIIWLLKEIKRLKMGVRMNGEIHDSHQASVPAAEIGNWLELCEETMVTRLCREWDWINVPLAVEHEVSPIDMSWKEKAVWVKEEDVWKPK